MQFACENCKTQLQIADEKVRGKRLIVRCKRCGSKIAIADPGLGGPPGPRLVSTGFPAARPSHQARPQQSQPAPARPEPAAHGHAARDTDIESTRAMESDVLEKALRASKQEAAASGPLQSAPAAPAPEIDAQQAPLAAPSEEPLWFAMLRGHQTGPVTRAELESRANAGEVGPRTYLWREGMDAWQRAKDVPELAFLFPQPAPAPVRPSSPPIAAPESSAPPPLSEAAPAPAAANDAEEPAQPASGVAPGSDEREREEDVARNLFTPAETAAAHQTPADLARWATDELAAKRDTNPKQAKAPSSARMFESAAPPHSRGPFAVFIVLMLLAVAAAVLWAVLGREKTPEARPDAAQSQAEAAPDSGKVAVAEPPPKPAGPPAAPRANAPPPSAPVVGLTAEQVHRKLDEHKRALQGCVDEAVHRDPNLRLGRIHIATTIDPSGKVTSARIDLRAVQKAPLGACLRKETRKIVFPPFTGEPFELDIPIVVSAGD